MWPLTHVSKKLPIVTTVEIVIILAVFRRVPAMLEQGRVVRVNFTFCVILPFNPVDSFPSALSIST